MSSRQSKRASFYKRQKHRRIIRLITKVNRGTPGFLGAVTMFSVNGKPIGAGAMFLGRAPS